MIKTIKVYELNRSKDLLKIEGEDIFIDMKNKDVIFASEGYNGRMYDEGYATLRIQWPDDSEDDEPLEYMHVWTCDFELLKQIAAIIKTTELLGNSENVNELVKILTSIG